MRSGELLDAVDATVDAAAGSAYLAAASHGGGPAMEKGLPRSRLKLSERAPRSRHSELRALDARLSRSHDVSVRQNDPI